MRSRQICAVIHDCAHTTTSRATSCRRGRSRREHAIDDPRDGGDRSRREHAIERTMQEQLSRSKSLSPQSSGNPCRNDVYFLHGPYTKMSKVLQFVETEGMLAGLVTMNDFIHIILRFGIGRYAFIFVYRAFPGVISRCDQFDVAVISIEKPA
jgi:hypothetical protein